MYIEFVSVMSLTFTLTNTGSTLQADFFPSVELNPAFEYEMGLLSFVSYNSIPNVDSTNNKFHYGSPSQAITIPEGTYEVADIAGYIQQELQKINASANITLEANSNTLITALECNFTVDLTPTDSIGRLLGLPSEVVVANKRVTSTTVVDIFKVNSVLVECSITGGSFINDRASHTIYQFFPSVPAGFKIVEEPTPVIYLPVTTHSISNITLRVIDQDSVPVNFRGERITVRLHLRRSHI